MTGLSRSIREGPIGPSPETSSRFCRPSSIPLESAPAQKVPPSPQSTATCAVSSASNARNASARATAVGPSTAFLASGRPRTMVVTEPCFSERTDMAGRLPGLCPPFGDWREAARALRFFA